MDFQLGETMFEDEAMKYKYSLSGGMKLTFGRKNKTVFEQVFLKNIFQTEVLYGINLRLDTSEYTHSTFIYNDSTIFGGLFLNLLF